MSNAKVISSNKIISDNAAGCQKPEMIPDYYALLKITPNADIYNIKGAYSKIIKGMSIPIGISENTRSKIEEEFAKYHKAFQVLSDPLEKEKYDLKLKLQQLREEEERVKKALEEKENQALKNEVNEPVKENQASTFVFSSVKIVDKRKIEEMRQEREKKRNEEKFAEVKQCIKKGFYDAALPLLRQLTEDDPKNAMYHSYLGLVLHSKGWENYALSEFKIALSCNPNDNLAGQYYKILAAMQEKRMLENDLSAKNKGFLGKLKNMFA